VVQADRSWKISETFRYPEVGLFLHAAYDPVAKIPEYKVCAVKVEKLAASKK